jgi:D-glycero-alpha-D-manno-heptose-7-phosphate kinase
MNPHCGYQDPYGCGIGGFKRMEFLKGGVIKYTALSTEIFDLYDAHLIFTGITRNSKEILSSVTDNIESAVPLIDITSQAFDALEDKNYKHFFNLMSLGWEKKKESTSLIIQNELIKQLDEDLNNNSSIISHKLCGAGNGGFFLTFSEKDSISLPDKYLGQYVKINVSAIGVKGSIV